MKKIILLLLLATGCINAYAQDDSPIATTSIKENTTGRKIKKMLILSGGPMSSRKIAQDLKYALDKEPFWSARIEISTDLSSDKYFDHLVNTLRDSWYAQMISVGN